MTRSIAEGISRADQVRGGDAQEGTCIETQHWIALAGLIQAIILVALTAAIKFAFTVHGRLTTLEAHSSRIAILETKLATLQTGLRIDGRMDLERGPYPLIERNSPVDIGDIVEVVKHLGINVREHPEFWWCMRELISSEPKDLADLLAWLLDHLGEAKVTERALLYKRSLWGYAEWWGFLVEKAQKEGVVAMVDCFGLTVEEYNELADAGQRRGIS